jgi:hypothetical protein
MVLIMVKCGYMDVEKKVDRFQLEQLVDRIGKESCELMQYRLKNKEDNITKLLYFLRIGITKGLHSFAAPRLLFKKGLFLSFPHKATVLGYNWKPVKSDC